MKIGVLGVGHLGKVHVKLLKEISEFDLVGFYDINPETSSYVSHTFGIKSFDSMQALIDEVDAIDIVTPTPTHFECAQAAVRAGKHVFIEKPVTFTVAESEGLIKLVNEAQVVAQVGHVERFNPAFLSVQDLICKPQYIDTERYAIYNTRGLDVPVVLDLMIHDLDIVLSTVRSPIKRISASGISVISDTVDIANARLEFLNGAVANLTVNRVAIQNIRRTKFMQADAYITVDFLNKTSEKFSIGLQGEQHDFIKIPLEQEEGKPAKEIVIQRPQVTLNNAIEDELRAFYNSIVNHTPSLVSLEDGHNAVVVAHQILEKIHNKL
jgi:predicted dehydrogenase